MTEYFVIGGHGLYLNNSFALSPIYKERSRLEYRWRRSRLSSPTCDRISVSCMRSLSFKPPIKINRSTMKLDLLYKYSYDFCCQPTNRNYSPT
ncbi:MAG: hypothetical protein AB1589_16850 [Cyanobacteriota bacterium]